VDTTTANPDVPADLVMLSDGKSALIQPIMWCRSIAATR